MIGNKQELPSVEHRRQREWQDGCTSHRHTDNKGVERAGFILI